MTRSNRTAMAVLAVCLSLSGVEVASAIDAVFIPGSSPFGSSTNGKIEVQGFNGRLDLATTIQGPASNSSNFDDSVGGAAANDSVLYTLLTPRSGSLPSIITESDTHNGAYLGTIQLPGQFSDIAYTNGHLYGVQALGGTGTTQSFQLVGIASNGATQPLVTQSASGFITPTWQVNGAVAGNSLLVTPNFNYGTTAGYVFTPSTPATPATTITLPNGTVGSPVIHSNGAAVTLGQFGSQADYVYPSGTLIGPRSTLSGYGATSPSLPLSDEFSYSYPNTQPAAVSLNTAFSVAPGSSNGLYRLPQTLTETATVSLQNGVAPDGTSISNVVASNLVGQTGGPTPLPITVQETDAPAGSFSQRQLAQANISVNLANASRGIYDLGTNGNLTGTYTYGGMTQTGRAISVTSSGGQGFAYDPISSNLVGNGDGSLDGFGWETTIDGETIGQFAFASSQGFELLPSNTSSQSLQQILQLPTSNGPMLLSFKYALDAFDSADIKVTLNGIDVGDVVIDSTTPGLFQATISSPALENLSDADLIFSATDAPGGSVGTSFAEIGNISLTAVPVPEPTGALFLGIGGLLLGRRRCRSTVVGV